MVSNPQAQHSLAGSMGESRHKCVILISHNLKLRILLLVFLLRVLGHDVKAKILSDILSACSFICKPTRKQFLWSLCQQHRKRNTVLLIDLFLSACSFYRNQFHLWSVSPLTSSGSMVYIFGHNPSTQHWSVVNNWGATTLCISVSVHVRCT